jgi:hypothetical protein
VGGEPRIRTFFENQELKRESRDLPKPGRWLFTSICYAIAALCFLGITVNSLRAGGHAPSPWWFTGITTVGLVVAMGGSLRRMMRDRKRLGLPNRPI